MKPSAITALRRRLRLTQERFAWAVGVAMQTVGRWERGEVVPSPLALERLRDLDANGAVGGLAVPSETAESNARLAGGK